MCAKRFVVSLVGMALLVLPTTVWAGESEAANTPASAVATASASAISKVAELRAEWFRTMTALAEERAKPQPDSQRIADLEAKLRDLRAEWVKAGPASVANPATGVCPWGGPGLGLGLGRGPGYAMGMGPGRGPGPGFGPASPAFGPRRGNGYGMRGPGRGMGLGPYFVDRNGNGICDYYEFRWGW
jgi:hypothetical protein